MSYDRSHLKEVFLELGLAPEEAEKFKGIYLFRDKGLGNIVPMFLMDHQMLGLHNGMYHNRWGLFDDPRTGKTPTMQVLAIFFAKYGYKSIFLMPPSLFLQFEETLGLIVNHGLKVETFKHSPAKRTSLMRDWVSNKVPTPDVLLMSTKIFLKHSKDMRRLGYLCLFWDEAHMGCGTEKNQIYKKVTEFVSSHEDTRLCLSTGTPIPNKLYNAFPLIHLKDPSLYGCRSNFDAAHVRFKKIRIRTPYGEKDVNVSDDDNYLNLDLLHNSLFAKSIRHTREQVLPLKGINVQIVPVQLTSSHLSEYRKFIKTRIAEFEDGTLVDGRQAQKLRQLSMQAVVNPETITDKKLRSNAVIETVRAIIDSIDIRHEKVVLFANYTRSVEKLAEEFKSLRPAVVYGPNGDKNATEIQRFQKDETCRILVANPISGGTGITAGQLSSTAIFAEPVSTPGQFQQAAARIIHADDTKPNSIYILNAEGTLYPGLIQLMLSKSATLDQVQQDRESFMKALLGDIDEVSFDIEYDDVA